MRAAIYARYSTDLQSAASIEDQTRLCKEHAQREGWDVTRCYADHGISGGSLIRPGFQKLMQDALAGDYDILLAEALDRVSRDQHDERRQDAAHEDLVAPRKLPELVKRARRPCQDRL